MYVDGIRVMLIIGPTGTGKSVHGNTLVALEQKYGGFTYIFDIGGSYETGSNSMEARSIGSVKMVRALIPSD